MDLNEYQKLAYTTAVYPAQHKISYPALGLVSEIGEYYHATIRRNKIDELGDICWYCAALATDLGLKLDDCARIGVPDNLMICGTTIAGYVKKMLRGDKGVKTSLIKLLIGNIIFTINMDFGAEEICRRNIQKLFDRRDRGVLKGDGDHR